MSFRKTIGKIHLWLGLCSGLVLFVIAITGSLYAFKDEIEDLYKSYRFTPKQARPFLPPSKLVVIAQNQLPDKKLHAIKYNMDGRSVEAVFFDQKPRRYYYISYINPYTGEVYQTEDVLSGFFRTVLKGHRSLWLPKQIGGTLVKYTTLLFFAILLSGFILWLPKSKNALRQRIWFRWKKSSTKVRKNYDLHAILGFYSLVFGIVFMVTGLVWSFGWFRSSYYDLLGGQKSIEYREPESLKSIEAIGNKSPIDEVWRIVKAQHADAKSIEVHPPENKNAVIATTANPDSRAYYRIDFQYFDQYSLKEIEVDHLYGKLKNASMADRIFRMNYDLHTGAVLGFGGKFIAFVFSTFIASLPITGILVWLWRNKKAKKKPYILKA